MYHSNSKASFCQAESFRRQSSAILISRWRTPHSFPLSECCCLSRSPPGTGREPNLRREFVEEPHQKHQTEVSLICFPVLALHYLPALRFPRFPFSSRDRRSHSSDAHSGRCSAVVVEAPPRCRPLKLQNKNRLCFRPAVASLPESGLPVGIACLAPTWFLSSLRSAEL